MEKELLTIKQAFKAMLFYLETQPDDLQACLGGMSFISSDGLPFARSIWTDWEIATKKARKESNSITKDALLTKKQAFLIVQTYFERLYNSGNTYLSDTITPKICNGSSINKNVWNDWLEISKKVINDENKQ